VKVGASAAAPLLADVNGDTLLDLVGFGDSQGIRVFPGLGTGLFAPGILTPMAPGASELEVGDVGVDGFPDLVVLHDLAGTDTLTVLGSDGSGAFTVRHVLAAESDSRGLALGDLDGDGFPELLSSGGPPSAVALRFDNDGAGGFLPHTAHALANVPVDVAMAELDGDGRPDVLALCTNSDFIPEDGVLTLLRNLGPEEPWTWLGQGKAGAAGIPMLVGHGTLLVGDPVSLELAGAAPAAGTMLVIGLAPAFAPLKGGVLVPQPDVLVGLATDGTGGALLQEGWPPGVPAGLQTWYQAWVLEASATLGLAASNGLTAIAP
jgi:hypothetical protein